MDKQEIDRMLFLKETGELSTRNISTGEFLSAKVESKFRLWLAAKQDLDNKGVDGDNTHNNN